MCQFFSIPQRFSVMVYKLFCHRFLSYRLLNLSWPWALLGSSIWITFMMSCSEKSNEDRCLSVKYWTFKEVYYCYLSKCTDWQSKSWKALLFLKNQLQLHYCIVFWLIRKLFKRDHYAFELFWILFNLLVIVRKQLCLEESVEFFKQFCRCSGFLRSCMLFLRSLQKVL